jgi:Rhodopirellula transposase DDE domain
MRQSLRGIKASLASVGVLLSHESVRRLLQQQKYSLKANRKSIASTRHPQRDLQFRYIERVKRRFINAGHPVISVDTKKKELIGNFKNAGQTWSQEAEAVNDHDFPEAALAKAVPYGIYDLVQNQGFVYVGTSGDTAAFAVDAIERWLKRKDRPKFADESKLLILCDSGGSNGYRVRNWKRQLQQQLADRYGMEVMVCHYPSGASKWNPIEHRLFSFISLNWAGKPLRSLNRMTALIRGTTTQSGLTVKATQLKGNYPTQIKVSDQEMAALKLTRRRICPQWNYVLHPRTHELQKA